MKYLNFIYFGVVDPVEPISQGQLTLINQRLNQWDASISQWIPIVTPFRFFFYDTVTLKLLLVKDDISREVTRNKVVFIDPSAEKILELRDGLFQTITDLSNDPNPFTFDDLSIRFHVEKINDVSTTLPLIGTFVRFVDLDNLSAEINESGILVTLAGESGSVQYESIIDEVRSLVFVIILKDVLPQPQSQIGFFFKNGQISENGQTLTLSNQPTFPYPVNPNYHKLVGYQISSTLNVPLNQSEGEATINNGGMYDIRFTSGYEVESISGSLIGTTVRNISGGIVIDQDTAFNLEPSTGDYAFKLVTAIGDRTVLVISSSATKAGTTPILGHLVATIYLDIDNVVHPPILQHGSISYIFTPNLGSPISGTNQLTFAAIGGNQEETIDTNPYFVMTKNDVIIASTPLTRLTLQGTKETLNLALQAKVDANVNPPFLVDIPSDADLRGFTVQHNLTLGNISIGSTESLSSGDVLKVYYVDELNNGLTVDSISTSFTGHRI